MKMTAGDPREAAMEGGPNLSHDAGLAFSLYSLTRNSRRLSSFNRVSVHGVQVQSRLPLLLGFRQQSERNDGGHGQALRRLAAWDRLPCVGVHGRRATAQA